MDINKIVSGLSSSGVLGGLAGGAVSGALMSNKKARKTAGTLLKVGGVAALGGLAWKAYQDYQGQKQPAPSAPSPANADPVWQDISKQRFAIADQDPEPGSTALLLVQAMIAAACADGHMDSAERRRILSQVDSLDLASDEKAMVFEALDSPLSLSALCERVDSPEVAAEVYLSSLVAVERHRTEARLYLDALAFRLGLPDGLVAQLHEQVEEADRQAIAEAS